MNLADRIECLSRLKRRIVARTEEIVSGIQKETSKSRTDALVSEVFSVLDHLDYLEKNATWILADRKVKTPLTLLGKRSLIYFEPLGRVLIISPWNYPFFLGVVPITSAFVCGNQVTYKPSEHTPLRGLLESLFEEAKIPPGTIEVVYGDGRVGEDLIRRGPDKIFFTGSTRTGKKILEAAAPLLIPVDLELGGKDPMIVFEDVNLDRAARGALWGGCTNLGQACTSVERVYVQETIYAPFRDRLVALAGKLTQGIDSDGSQDLGEMAVDFQVDKVRRQLTEALEHGAQVLTGGLGQARKLPATVIDQCPPGVSLLKEETFGPVLPLVPFRDEEEAVRLANDSEYGLSASVWSADLKRADRVARRLKVGAVSINNVMLTEGNPALPFGGIKKSGYSRCKGEFGLYTFCNIKSVLVDKNSAKGEGHWYPYTREKYQLFTELIRSRFMEGAGNFLRFLVTGIRLESLAARLTKKAGHGS